MKQCIIFGAYPVSGVPKLAPGKDNVVIAADGGLMTAKHFGITPDFVLGDFDSLPVLPGEDAEYFPAEKDDTDMMLAIKNGLSLGLLDFMIYGGIGGRLSHTYANMQALAYLKRHGAAGKLLGDGTTVCFLENEAMTVGKTDGYVSVLAHSPSCIVTLDGFYYPLDYAKIDNRFPLGVSNRVISGNASITINQGSAFVILEEQD